MKNSKRASIATIASSHWLEQEGILSSAIPGSQCSCGGQSSNCGGWSAVAQDTEQDEADR
jgi:hypothetical protein